MRGPLRVDAPEGGRWDLAVTVLEHGGGFVRLQSLVLYRDMSGPRADGALHVEIVSTVFSPANLTMTRAETEIASGLRLLDQVLRDERMARLVDQHGLVREYVQDDGTSRVLVAEITADNSVVWRHDRAHE